jgi:hypothetical protein
VVSRAAVYAGRSRAGEQRPLGLSALVLREVERLVCDRRGCFGKVKPRTRVRAGGRRGERLHDATLGTPSRTGNAYRASDVGLEKTHLSVAARATRDPGANALEVRTVSDRVNAQTFEAGVQRPGERVRSKARLRVGGHCPPPFPRARSLRARGRLGRFPRRRARHECARSRQTDSERIQPRYWLSRSANNRRRQRAGAASTQRRDAWRVVSPIPPLADL